MRLFYYYYFPLLCWIIVGRNFPCPLPPPPGKQPPMVEAQRTDFPCSHPPLPAPSPLIHCPIFRPQGFILLLGERGEWSDKSLPAAGAALLQRGGMWLAQPGDKRTQSGFKASRGGWPEHAGISGNTPGGWRVGTTRFLPLC